MTLKCRFFYANKTEGYIFQTTYNFSSTVIRIYVYAFGTNFPSFMQDIFGGFPRPNRAGLRTADDSEDKITIEAFLIFLSVAYQFTERKKVRVTHAQPLFKYKTNAHLLSYEQIIVYKQCIVLKVAYIIVNIELLKSKAPIQHVLIHSNFSSPNRSSTRRRAGK